MATKLVLRVSDLRCLGTVEAYTFASCVMPPKRNYTRKRKASEAFGTVQQQTSAPVPPASDTTINTATLTAEITGNVTAVVLQELRPGPAAASDTPEETARDAVISPRPSSFVATGVNVDIGGAENVTVGDNAIQHITNILAPPDKSKEPTDTMDNLVESWKNCEEEYVETTCTNEIKQAVESHNVITITGCLGSGKSSNLHHMALKLQEGGYCVYPVLEFEEITKTFYIKNTKKKQVFTLDDPFGKGQLKTDKVRDLEKLNESLIACFNDKSKKLLLAVRTEIYNELPKSTIVSLNVVNVEKANESSKERKMFLSKVMGFAPDDRILELASNCDVPFFPLICHLYVKDETHKGSEGVFVNSANVLKDRFEEMLCEDQDRFRALAVCVVYSEAGLPLPSVTKLTDDDEKLQMCIDSFSGSRVNFDNFEKQLKLLCGVYLEENNRIYKFRHDIFRNIVAYVLAEKKYRFFFEHCDMELCLEIFTFGLPTINDRICLQRDICRAKTLSVGPQHTFDKSSNTSDSLQLEESLLALLATVCVEKLIANTECENSKLVRTIINSALIQNDYFFRKFHSKVKSSKMDEAQKAMITNELFSSACLSLETSVIEEIFPGLLPYKGKHDNKIDVTPLLACAYSSKIDMMKQLVQTQDRYKMEVNSQSPISPLSLSVFKSNYKSVEFLLENHADVNCGNPTPFILAFEQSSLEMADLLISKGADINQKYRYDKTGFFTTPLCWACEKGCNEKVKYLIDHKVDVNKCDGVGNSPLTNSIKSDYMEVVEMLLGHETINLNICGEGEKAQTPLCFACSNGNEKIVKRLMRQNADVKKCDGNANSPLINAVKGNHRDIVKHFLDSKVDVGVNKLDLYGNTALACSILYSDIEITECLLKFEKIDLNYCGEGQNADTPLCRACFLGNSKIVEKLVECGADVSKCNADGDTPLKLAKSVNHAEIIKLLQKKL